MTTAVQLQSNDQRMANLAEGNRIRMATVELRKELNALPRDEAFARIEELLKSPTEAAGALKLERLLNAPSRVGEHKVTQLIKKAPQFNHRRRYARVRDLTSRERAAIILALRARRGK